LSASPLRAALQNAIAERSGGLATYTVLDTKNDPFRLDTPANHRDGEWVGEVIASLGLGTSQIHLRGVHYAILGRPKPDGSRYQNDDDNWEWLQNHAMKAARWLGYVGFDQIYDKRNAAPVIKIRERGEPAAYLTTELDVSIPSAWELEPQINVDGFEGTQPYRLALIGEKASLETILAPLAAQYDTDLFLPTSEISDTQIYLLAKAAADDGRPLVVLYFADCDPAGWQMGVSVSRKLQAFRTLLPKMPDFELQRVALTPEWVTEYNAAHVPLASSPLKETEKRGDKWREAWGIEQTEIDSLLIPNRPDLHAVLRQLARDAIAPYYDQNLDPRVFEAKSRWLDEAQEAVNEIAGSAQLEAIRDNAARQLDAMRQQIRQLNDELRIDTGDIVVPPIVIPEAEVSGAGDLPPLLDSRWPFAEQCQRLIASKAYDQGGQPQPDAA
jgi:hypothetical protein